MISWNGRDYNLKWNIIGVWRASGKDLCSSSRGSTSVWPLSVLRALHTMVFIRSLTAIVYNKWCCWPGRKFAPNKWDVPATCTLWYLVIIRFICKSHKAGQFLCGYCLTRTQVEKHIHTTYKPPHAYQASRHICVLRMVSFPVVPK